MTDVQATAIDAPRDFGLAPAAERALVDAGLPPDAGRTIRPLSRSWLSSAWAVQGPTEPLVLKLYPLDLKAHIRADPDPRFRTFAARFPIAPFFTPSAVAAGAARSVLGDRVPRVIAEGALPDGVRYTLMTEVRGRRWDRRAVALPGALRRLSSGMGDLLARLHGAPLPAAAAPDSDRAWLDDCAAVLHCVVDDLPGFARPARRGRHAGHLRAERLLSRLRQTDLGARGLAHCDFHPTNLLFEDDGSICGLVDLQLACEGPAALDFRWLSMLDAEAFLAAYGRYDGTVDDACWLGHFFDALWQGLALVSLCRFGETRVALRARIAYAAHFGYLMRLCDDDGLRRGRAARRRLLAMGLRAKAALRWAWSRDTPRPGDGAATARARPRVAIVVPTWNHIESTTRPCLDALRRFTDVDHRLVCVDNGSTDGTRALLADLAARDPCVELVLHDDNLGWARGTLAGLRRVVASDTHVLLLNSDTIVGPRWLSKLLGHLEGDGQNGAPSFVVPNEYPDADGAPGAGERDAAAMTPGTLHGAPPPARDAVLRLSADVQRRFAGQSRPAAPSGFCLLFGRAEIDVVRRYLEEFDRFRSKERDWYAWWIEQERSCRVALDTFVFHARGGSGGYYRYDRERAL